MSVVLPRLSREHAIDLIASARRRKIDATTAALPDHTLDRTWPPVGDDRITDEQLLSIRSSVVAAARDCGMPDSGDVTAFDAICARILYEQLKLSPHEAAHEEGWTYLTCCWLMDVAVWRFGPAADERRFVGNVNRNVFRRLWWRAEILGDQVDLASLGEDELVNIMERPTLAADPQLAQAIAIEFLRTVDADPSVQRMLLMRDATKRILRLTPFVEFGSLDSHLLTIEVAAAFDASAAALAGRPAPPQTDYGRRSRRAPSPEVQSLDRIHVATEEQSHDHDAMPNNQRPDLQWTGDQIGLVAVDLARRTGRVTNESMRDLLNITSVDARRILQNEVRLGRLEQRGQKRGTYYSLPSGQGASPNVAVESEPIEETRSGDSLGRSNPTLLNRLLGRRG